MPNRIIKESTFTSDKIAELSDFEFRLWIGLITQADDVGRGDARPKIIKGRVFSLRDRVTITDIDKALQRLAATGCVSLYTVGGKPYYEFPNWAEHQRIRNVQPKYPGMDEADNLRQSAAICGEMRLESESESESNTNPNVCTEQAPLASVPPLPLNNGEEYTVTVASLDEWIKLYPAVDVEQELRNMRGWLNANKSRRKTPSGIERFIVNWLSSEQNKGPKKSQQSKQTTPASYDIDRAERKMNSLPILKKKGEQ